MSLAVVLFFLLFLVIGVIRDRRAFRNAVFLVLFLGAASMWLLHILSPSTRTLTVVLVVLAVLAPISVLVLAIALIVNGVQMLRRERHSVGNILSLLAGIGILAFTVLLATALGAQVSWLLAGTALAFMVIAYVAFVFTCFLLYGVLYGWIGYRSGVDAIIVLGSGLLGSRVPPLLASRLDRAAAIHRREVARGGEPVVVVSGGQGPGEDVSEAAAMAEYLDGQGISGDTVVLEDRSTTTGENVRFSVELLTARLGKGFRAVAVTNNFHVFRAALLARRLHTSVQVTGSRTAFYYLPSAVLREFVGILVQYRWVHVGILVPPLGLLVVDAARYWVG